MDQITKEEIFSYLENEIEIKKSIKLISLVKNNHYWHYELICQTIKDVLNDEQQQSIFKFLAIKLSQSLIGTFSQKFIDQFEMITLESIKQYAEYDIQNQNNNRGIHYFGEDVDIQQKKIAKSIVQLASECIIVWAKFFPQKITGQQSIYFKYFLELNQKGLNIDNFKFFKQTLIDTHKSEIFDQLYQKAINKYDQKEELKERKLKQYKELILKLKNYCQNQENQNTNIFGQIKQEIISYQQNLDQLVNDQDIINIKELLNLILYESSQIEDYKFDLIVLRIYCQLSDEKLNLDTQKYLNELIKNYQQQRLEIFNLKKQQQQREQTQITKFDQLQSIFQQCPIKDFIKFDTCNFKNPQQISFQERSELIDFSQYEVEDFEKLTQKGKIIQDIILFQQISKDNILFFKQQCLGNEGILYNHKQIKFYKKSKIFWQDNNQFYTYGLFIKNCTNIDCHINVKFQQNENSLIHQSFKQFWTKPQIINKQLTEDQIEIIQIIVQTNEIIQQIPIQLEIDHKENILISLPININQQIIYEEFKLDDFLKKWEKLENQTLIQTGVFILNIDAFPNYQSFIELIPNLQILNENKLQQYEQGKSNLQIGGTCLFNTSQFLLLIEFKQNHNICVYICYDNQYKLYSKQFEKILSIYRFILAYQL